MRFAVLAVLSCSATALASPESDYVTQRCVREIELAAAIKHDPAVAKLNRQLIAQYDSEARDCMASAQSEYRQRVEVQRRYDAEQTAIATKRAQAEREEAARRSEEAAAVDAMREDPLELRKTMSAVICSEQKQRREALAELSKRKKYARLGGVENLSELYDLQQQVRESDYRILKFKKGLQARRLKQLACSEIAEISQCIKDEGNSCDGTLRRYWVIAQPEM